MQVVSLSLKEETVSRHTFSVHKLIYDGLENDVVWEVKGLNSFVK